MLSRQRLLLSFFIMMGLTVLLIGCTRPAPEGEATAVASEPDTSDPNVGGGTSLDPTSAPEVEEPSTVPETEATEPETDESEAGYPAAEETIDVEATAVPPTEEAAGEVVTPKPAPEDAAETEVQEESGETAVVAETSPPACPQDHVVQPGENLFRIGLQYGVSWVTLAQYNGISNPNNITVGQTIKIPCDGEIPPVQPTSPPDNVAYYTVQPGDNLFQIGLKFGVSWVEIAEANGLVNPNQIYAGQVLKIPTSAPGDRPEFTHIVKSGETVYSISLQYGVSAAAIAEANSLEYPYVIYAGQPLIIPGNS